MNNLPTSKQVRKQKFILEEKGYYIEVGFREGFYYILFYNRAWNERLLTNGDKDYSHIKSLLKTCIKNIREYTFIMRGMSEPLEKIPYFKKTN